MAERYLNPSRKISFAFGPIDFELQPVIEPVLQLCKPRETLFTYHAHFCTVISSLQSSATVTVGCSHQRGRDGIFRGVSRPLC
jgi:hypothetical protein